jgi:hypothetical protein
MQNVQFSKKLPGDDQMVVEISREASGICHNGCDNTAAKNRHTVRHMVLHTSKDCPPDP